MIGTEIKAPYKITCYIDESIHSVFAKFSLTRRKVLKELDNFIALGVYLHGDDL